MHKRNKIYKQQLEDCFKIGEKRIVEELEKQIQNFKLIEFQKFSIEDPYEGELKNKIFIYHHNHYAGNGSTWLEVGKLTHPYTNYEDRGYIKGVALDLENYLKLKLNVKFNLNDVFYKDQFSKYVERYTFNESKNKQTYQKEKEAILLEHNSKKENILENYRDKYREFIKDFTGCSLEFYYYSI